MEVRKILMSLNLGDDSERWVAETLRVKLHLRLESLCVRVKIEETIFVYSWQLIRNRKQILF